MTDPTPLLVLDVVGLTPVCSTTCPTSRPSDSRVPRPAGHRAARRDLCRPVHLPHRRHALRARHRRQRLVLPGTRRRPAVAAAQRPRLRRQALGRRPPRPPRLHRRQHLLVVRHGRGHRHHRHPRPVYYADGRKGTRLLHPAARPARRTHREVRHVPPVPLLGPRRRPGVQPVDHRRHPPRHEHPPPRPDPLLPPSPRLRPPALRPRRPALPEGRRRPRHGPRPASGRRPRRGTHRRRPLRVRHHPRQPARGHQPRPAPRRPPRGAHPGRHGVPRPDGLPRVRRRRPSDRPRLRAPPGGPRRHPGGPRRTARHRAAPRRRGQEGPPPRPSARRRAGRRRRTRRLVHVLLLARRRPRARLRAARRDPPQTRLRPGRAVHGPHDPYVKVKAAGALARKKLGMRYRMAVVPLDASPVRGSHGRLPASDDDGPLLICSTPALSETASRPPTSSNSCSGSPDSADTPRTAAEPDYRE